MVQRVVDPELGETTQIGVPFTLDAAPGAIKGGQPRPGEQTREILTELGLPAALVERAAARAQQPQQAAAG
jgi:crotonobetainyl-CoA:carnitine CoA-transferase CaiB-like acyl-CoA transferase